MNDFIVDASIWLWDYYILATLLLAAILLGGRFLAQPARRMALHWATAAALVLLALLCAIPGWSVFSVAPPIPHDPWMDKEMESFAGPAYQWLKEPLQPQDLGSIQTPSSFPTNSIKITPAVPGPASIVTPADSMEIIDYGVISLYVVVAGSGIVLIWLLIGVWQVRRLCHHAKPAPQDLSKLFAKFTKPGGRVPQLGVSERLLVAAAVGLRRPMVLIPKSFLERSGLEKLHTVLAHEMAHVHNRDLWMLALLRGLLLLLWAHPLYWLWKRSVRLDQETLADLDAAEVTSRADYAAQLVAWAHVASEARAPRLASSVGLWESPSQLKRRITILLNEQLTLLRRCSRRWRVGSVVLLVLMATNLSLVTLQPAEEAVAEVENKESALDSYEETPEVEYLEELVKGYESVFKEIEALRGVGAQGGEETNYLLAKYRLSSARGEVREAKLEFPEALREYQAALEVAKEYLPVAKEVYKAGRIDLGTLLNAQRILAEAKTNVQRLAVNAGTTEKLPRKFDISEDITIDFLVNNRVIGYRNFSDNELPDWLGEEWDIEESYSFEPSTVIDKLRFPFDEMAGFDGALAGVLEGLEHDPSGPRINVQNGVLDNLTGVVFFLRNNKSGLSGAWLVALDTRDEEALRGSVNRLMRSDPNGILMKVGGQEFWRIKDTSTCICVALGELFIASNDHLLESVLRFDDSIEGSRKDDTEQSKLLTETLDPFVDDGEENRQREEENDGVLALPTAPSLATTGTAQLVKLAEEPAAKANTMTLVCRDEAGKPIVGATATLYRSWQVESRQEKIRTLTTDGKGVVTFSDVLPANVLAEAQRQRRDGDFATMQDPLCVIVVQKAGYAHSMQYSSPFQLSMGEDRREVTLQPRETVVAEETTSGQAVVEESQHHRKRDSLNEDMEANDQAQASLELPGEEQFDVFVPINEAGTEELVSMGTITLVNPPELGTVRFGDPNVMEGSCVDPEGKPLAGMTITVYRNDHRRATHRQIAQTKSDDSGKFRIENLVDLTQEYPEGVLEQQAHVYRGSWINLHATARGEGWATQESVMGQDTFVVKGKTWNIRFQPSASLKGRITDTQGQPISNALVSASSTTLSGITIEGVRSTRTNSDGEYDIVDLARVDAEKERRLMEERQHSRETADGPVFALAANSLYLLRVSHPEFANRTAQLDRVPGVMDVVLEPGAVITGRVVDAQGEPMANAEVWLQTHPDSFSNLEPGEQYSDYQNIRIPTNEEGRYLFRSLGSATYSLRAFHHELTNEGLVIRDIPPGELTKAPDLVLSPGGVFRIRLIHKKDGKPISFSQQSTAFITSQMPSKSYGETEEKVAISPDGRFELRVPPGEHVLSIPWAGSKLEPSAGPWCCIERSFDNTTSIGAGETIEVDLPVEDLKERQRRDLEEYQKRVKNRSTSSTSFTDSELSFTMTTGGASETEASRINETSSGTVVVAEEPEAFSETLDRFVDDGEENRQREEENDGDLALTTAPSLATTGTAQLVKLAKEPAANANTMTLVCRDEAGKPIVGATATLYRSWQVESRQEKIRTLTTDGKGVVTFSDVLSANILAEAQRQRRDGDFATMQDPLCVIVVQKAGYAHSMQYSSPFQLSMGEDRREVTLRLAKTLSGSVQNEDGEPISGALVVVGTSARTPIEGVNATKTDKDGRYELRHLPEFDTASAAEGGMDQYVLFLAVSDEIAAQPRKKPKYDPLSSAIYVSHPDYATTRLIAGDIPGSCDVTLNRGAAFSGRIVHAVDGRPAAGIPVRIEGRPRGLSQEQDPRSQLSQLLGPHSALTKTDREGRYKFSNVPLGHYTIIPQSSTSNIMKAPWIAPGITVATEKVGETKPVQDIKLSQGGKLRGQLVDATTGQALSFDEQGAQLNVIFVLNVVGPMQTFSAQGVSCERDGTFECRTPPGRFRILVFADDLSQETKRTYEFTTGDDADRSGPIYEASEGEEIVARIRVFPKEIIKASRERHQEAFRLIEKGNYKEAIDSISNALEQFPKSRNLLYTRAMCYERLGDFQKALEDYQAIIDVSDNELLAHNNMAHILATAPDAKIRDGKRAVRLAEQATGFLVTNDSRGAAELYDTLAAAYAETGNFEKAISIQEKALERGFPEKTAEFREHLELYKVGKPLRMKPQAVKDKAEDNEKQSGNPKEVPPWTVEGRVTDTSGKGIADVEIRAATGIATLLGGGSTKTDREGRYRLHFEPSWRTTISKDTPLGVGVQAATIFASKPGYFETNLCRQGDLLMSDGDSESFGEGAKRWGKDVSSVVFPNRPRKLNFQLAPAAVIEGKLEVDGFYWDFSNDSLFITGEKLPPSSSVLTSLKTDLSGNFRLEELPIGFDWRFGMPVVTGVDVESESFRADKPGRYRCRLILDVNKEEKGNVEMALRLESLEPIEE